MSTRKARCLLSLSCRRPINSLCGCERKQRRVPKLRLGNLHWRRKALPVAPSTGHYTCSHRDDPPLVGRAMHLSWIQGLVNVLKFNKQLIHFLNCLYVNHILTSNQLAECLI